MPWPRSVRCGAKDSLKLRLKEREQATCFLSACPMKRCQEPFAARGGPAFSPASVCESAIHKLSDLHNGAPLSSAQDHTPELTFPQTTIDSMVEVVAAKDEADNENFG